jgi:hypothetical protein
MFMQNCNPRVSTAPITFSAAFIGVRILCLLPLHICILSNRYRLHFLASDESGEAEFNLSGRVARSLVGVSVHQVILNNYQGDMPIGNLLHAASQIQHTPPELAALVNTTYKFFVHVGNADFQGNWASFNVLAVENIYALE